MADQTVNLNIKAVDQASAEMAKVAQGVERLNRQVQAYGTATGPAKAASAQFYDTLRSGRGIIDGTATGLGGVNKAAKDLATGGLRDILSEVPIVGGALSKLAGTLGGFPLLLGGIAAAGLGVLKFLQGLSQDADKAVDSTAKLAESIGTNFRQTLLEVERIQAEAAGNQDKALELGAQKAIEAAKSKVDALIAQAEREKQALDLFGRQRGEANRETLDAITKAEADLANTTILENAKKNAGLQKLENERVDAAKKAREEEVKAAAEAAEKQRKLIEDLTDQSLNIFKRLGAGFEEVAQKLELAQFVKETETALGTLRQAFENGVISQEAYSKGTQTLTEKMQEAVRLGYVPLIEKTQEAAAETEKAAEVAVDAGEAWRKSIADTYPFLDELIKKGQAAQEAMAGASAGGGGAAGGGFAGSTPGTGPTGLTAAPSNVGSGLGNPGAASTVPLSELLGNIDIPSPSSGGGESFAAGGVVPGPPGKPIRITAHGGEEFLGVGAARRQGGRTTVVNVTVNQSGTVIQQERDWDTLVENLGQSLDARLARVG